MYASNLIRTFLLKENYLKSNKDLTLKLYLPLSLKQKLHLACTPRTVMLNLSGCSIVPAKGQIYHWASPGVLWTPGKRQEVFFREALQEHSESKQHKLL